MSNATNPPLLLPDTEITESSLVRWQGLPAIVEAAGESASRSFVEFFAATIRNSHTRKAYTTAVKEFFGFLQEAGARSLGKIEPVLVAAWVEQLALRYSPQTVKQRLAAVRMLCDHLVRTGVLRVNPAAAVRGPRLTVRTGKTPALQVEEVRDLIYGMIPGPPEASLRDLRDRALLGVMLYTFVRVDAAIGLRVRDYQVVRSRACFLVHEKGGQLRRVAVHSELVDLIDDWLEAAGHASDQDAPLLQSFAGRTGRLSGRPVTARDALRIVKARAGAAGLPDVFGSHSLRASGITLYLEAGGTLENAAAMAGHASTRTTQLYDRRRELAASSDIERIRLRGGQR